MSVVLFGTDRDTVLARLEALEDRSRKGRVKWRRARVSVSPSLYVLLDMPLLAESIFVTTFRHAHNYFDLTVRVPPGPSSPKRRVTPIASRSLWMG